jgi:hypothetical protein
VTRRTVHGQIVAAGIATFGVREAIA